MTTTQRSKEDVVAHILQQEVYATDSGSYARVRDSLLRLPLDVLQTLDVMLVFRITESNELCRKVDRIMAGK